MHGMCMLTVTPQQAAERRLSILPSTWLKFRDFPLATAHLNMQQRELVTIIEADTPLQKGRRETDPGWFGSKGQKGTDALDTRPYSTGFG